MLSNNYTVNFTKYFIQYGHGVGFLIKGYIYIYVLNTSNREVSFQLVNFKKTKTHGLWIQVDLSLISNWV